MKASHSTVVCPVRHCSDGGSQSFSLVTSVVLSNQKQRRSRTSTWLHLPDSRIKPSRHLHATVQPRGYRLASHTLH